MSDEVLIAIIAALVPAAASVVVQLIVNSSRKKEAESAYAVHEQKQQDAIEAVNKELAEVKKKLDTHNHYAEKFSDIEKNIAVIQKDLEYLRRK